MQFTTVLAILAATAGLVAADSGFTVPEGTPEGVYTVYRNEAGDEVHEPVDTTFSSRFAARAQPLLAEKRATTPPGVTTCNGAPDNGLLNGADTDKANAMLDAQCGGWHGVGSGKHFYSISGGVVAYFCNFADQDYGCSNGVRAQYSAEISAACGRYKAGWVRNTDTGYLLGGGEDYAYGYAPSTNKFCGCGTKC